MNLDKATEFVRRNGNKFEQARLNHIMGLDYDKTGVLKGLSFIQNPDGGFPYGDIKGFPSCLSNTAMALHNLAEMGLTGSEVAEKSVIFLKNMQAKKGTWPENIQIKPLDPPFWDMPEDDLTTLWLTADISDLMLRTGNTISKKTVRYLMNNQTSEGNFEGYIHTTWIALSIFGRKGIPDEDVFLRTKKYLENADIEDWDASCIAWCLGSMKNGGVEKDSVLWDKLLMRLSATQEPDGSWPSEDGEHHKVRDINSVLAAVWDFIDK